MGKLNSILFYVHGVKSHPYDAGESSSAAVSLSFDVAAA